MMSRMKSFGAAAGAASVPPDAGGLVATLLGAGDFDVSGFVMSARKKFRARKIAEIGQGAK